jgi:hypothetical protein
MLGQTVETWFSFPVTIHHWLQHRISGAKNACVANITPKFDGGQFWQIERGKYPTAKSKEVLIPLVCAYNSCDRQFKNFHAYSIFHTKDVLECSTNLMANIHCILFEINAGTTYATTSFYRGYRSQTGHIGVLGCVVRTGPGYDDEEAILYEGIRWKKADIKHAKANIKLAKNPNLINAKKAEIKKIKADNWMYKKFGEIGRTRWSRWKYREIWELKDEIKRLKKKGRGKERIEEIEVPKDRDALGKKYLFGRRYLYPYRLNRERVELKSEDEYTEEIRRIKEEIKVMKEVRKERIKNGLEEGRKWLEEDYRDFKKKKKENERSQRIRELRRKWKERKKWIMENSEKKDLSYKAFCASELMDEETQKKMSELYIPTIDDFERKYFQEVRGDTLRDPSYSEFGIGKLYTIETRRFLENHKGKGFGRTMKPSVLSEYICRESRGDFDFNTLVFRTANFNKGIGEWKELDKEVRKKIPFPLVYRPIKDKYGYAIGAGENSMWECRPLHPSDAWFTWKYDQWRKVFTPILWLLSKVFERPHFFGPWDTIDKYSEGYVIWPFDRWLIAYSPINRLLIWLLTHA